MSEALSNTTVALNTASVPLFENNIHIVANSFSYGSRILKQTESLLQSQTVKRVFIVGLHDAGSREHEEIDSHRSVWRIRLRTRSWPKFLGSQIFKYLEYCTKVVLFARKKNIQLVNVHHVGLLPLGVFLKFICRAKLVYDTHELETETYELGRSKLRKRIAKFVEAFFIRFVNLVIVVSGGIRDWYGETYKISNIVMVLNCPKLQKKVESNLLREELGILDQKKIVLYQGGLVLGRGIEGLLRAFAENNDDRHVLVFMGYGELEDMIKEYSKTYSNIFFQPAAKPVDVLKYTASANVGVSYIDNPSLNDELCLPNKLFEYIMVGLPVIVNNAREQKSVIEGKKIGVVLNELTPRSMASALAQLEAMESETLQSRLQDAAQEFSWGQQEQVMIEAYKTHLMILKS